MLGWKLCSKIVLFSSEIELEIKCLSAVVEIEVMLKFSDFEVNEPGKIVRKSVSH